MAKIIMPDDQEQKTEETIQIRSSKSTHTNLIMAAASGATEGIKLAVTIGGMLIAFVALIALLNSIFTMLGSVP